MHAGGGEMSKISTEMSGTNSQPHLSALYRRLAPESATSDYHCCLFYLNAVSHMLIGDTSGDPKQRDTTLRRPSKQKLLPRKRGLFSTQQIQSFTKNAWIHPPESPQHSMSPFWFNLTAIFNLTFWHESIETLPERYTKGVGFPWPLK